MDSLLTNLPTLLAISRMGSLTAAAKQLGVPRSTVSRRLARLEQELGVLLAERNTRTFKLTEPARRLAGEAAAVVTHLQSLSESISFEAGQVRTEAEVRAVPEHEVRVGTPTDIQSVGIPEHCLVTIGGRERDDDLLPCENLDTAQVTIRNRGASKGHHWRPPPKQLLDRVW